MKCISKESSWLGFWRGEISQIMILLSLRWGVADMTCSTFFHSKKYITYLLEDEKEKFYREFY